MKHFLCITGFLLFSFQDPPKTIVDYFNLFVTYPDITLTPSENNDPMVDMTNAYIRVKHQDPDAERELVFTYFLKADKTKLFGNSIVTDGADATHYEISFNTYNEQKNEWTDVTEKVLPELESQMFLGRDSSIQCEYQYILPQTGTTIEVIIQYVAPTDYEGKIRYEEYIDLFTTKKSVFLTWDKVNGIFTVKK